MTGDVLVRVDPGICGFYCEIRASLPQKRVARLCITESKCEHIQRLNAGIGEVGMRDLFLPLCRNPVFIAAEKAGCHAACPVPTALIKAAEAVMGLAIPKSIVIDIGLEA
ncbi:MAG: hypothetical protein V2B19_09885 [Pseudomonadota bacterium]